MNPHVRAEHRSLVLWTVLLAPAFAWFAQVTASYTIGAYACANDRMWILHAISIAALAIASVGVWSGWRDWRSLRSRSDESGRERGRLTGGALLLAMLFLLAILVSELSNWLLEPCI